MYEEDKRTYNHMDDDLSEKQKENPDQIRSDSHDAQNQQEQRKQEQWTQGTPDAGLPYAGLPYTGTPGKEERRCGQEGCRCYSCRRTLWSCGRAAS